MSALSREQARKIVDGIKTENGGSDEKDRAQILLVVLAGLSSVRRKLVRTTSM